ncbi:MAG: tRNA uridine-5-carboxymethylaminomethyl(34) synthesis GTPase MnmE [Vampirovibrionales bacterium]|nr:tRNA uridine-5-carboxymethylaminomethyl(34) synthesis GTPase MnmE [Vampirovibrionales bacterium]
MSLSVEQDTIAAIATPRGQGAIAIIRLSGPQAWGIARRVALIKPRTPRAGRAYVGWAIDPARPDAPPLDEVLILLFSAPKSATGEDIAEIHCHGGDYLAAKLLDCCLRAGARAAQRGEFSKRAFLNGRMDLSQAESILDLITARGDRMLGAACHNLKTRALAQAIEALSAPLIRIQAELTACADFPDEAPEPDRRELANALGALQSQARALAAGADRARLIREGFSAAILGKPNAGKSSLFNALLARERAIVTATPGATRDALREEMAIEGVTVTLIDTAGIRDSDDPVETIGIARSWQAADDAQAALYLYDATQGLSPEDAAILQRLEAAGAPVLRIASQCDRLDARALQALPDDSLPVSSQSGRGLSDIVEWLGRQANALCGEAQQDALALNDRQLSRLGHYLEAVSEALETVSREDLPLDLATVPITSALRELDALLGRDTTEAVITETFSRFCVGK